jgi:chloramphenicol 3-O phosphotransferase
MRLPDVIFLNGSTSAGKTSIGRALQARLPQPYLLFGIDHLFPWLPPAWCETKEGYWFERTADGGMPIVIGEGFLSVERGWHRMVRAGVDAGLRFVVDEALIDPRLLPDWLAVLAGCDVLWVGVRCELAELQRREKARGDRGIGQAQAQHEAVHAGVAYDLEVNTTATSAGACAEVIIGRLGVAG